MTDVFESLTNTLVHIAKHGTEEQVKQTVDIMEEGWAKIDEVLDPAWYNKEVMTMWKEHLKNKK